MKLWMRMCFLCLSLLTCLPWTKETCLANMTDSAWMHRITDLCEGKAVIFIFAFASLCHRSSCCWTFMCLIFLSSAFLSSTVFTLSLSQTLLNRLDHLIAHTSCLRKTRSKVRLYLLEFAAVAIHVAKWDAFGPILFGKKEVSERFSRERVRKILL